MSPLFGLLNVWRARPGVWGVSDCALALADWYQVCHGADPAAHLRGTYHDAASCARVTNWFQDPVAVVEGCLATVGGLPRVDGPAVGDVGILEAVDCGRAVPLGAVFAGKFWAARVVDDAPGSAGVVTFKARLARPMAIWGMGYEI